LPKKRRKLYFLLGEQLQTLRKKRALLAEGRDLSSLRGKKACKPSLPRIRKKS